MRNSYNVAFYDRDEQIEMRKISVGFIENSFPRHKPFVDHVFVGWKTDERTYRKIWPGDKFYLIDESCSYVSEYDLPLNLHVFKVKDNIRFDAIWANLNDYLFVTDDGVLKKKGIGIRDLTLQRFSIPETLNGKIIKEIGDETFRDCEHLKSVTLPKTVTKIGKKAFAYCCRLTSINLNKNIRLIENEAFMSSHISSVTFPITLKSIGRRAFKYAYLKTVDLPDSVTYLGEEAFSCCDLKSLKLSESLSAIEEGAFSETSLSELYIPDSVSVIKDSAFYRCNDLERIRGAKGLKYIGSKAFAETRIAYEKCIPESTVSIGDFAFDALRFKYEGKNYEEHHFPPTKVYIPRNVSIIETNAFGLGVKTITVDKDNQKYSAKNGVLFDKEGKTLIKYPPMKPGVSYSVPEGTEAIGESAFSFCENLKSVIIPNSVKEIGKSAFWRCSNLKSIKISDSVTSIGDDAFAGCMSLKEIQLPSSLNFLGDRAFALLDINITLSEGSSNFKMVDGCLFDKEGDTLFYYSNNGNKTKYTVPDGVKKIGGFIFFNSDLEEIVLPNSISVIEEFAFCRSKIKNIIIPDSVTRIGDHAFESCYYLNEAKFGKNIK